MLVSFDELIDILPPQLGLAHDLLKLLVERFVAARPVDLRLAGYNLIMSSSPITRLTPPLIGHVKNGVVVLDVQGCLLDGQSVRVEPVDEIQITPVDAERAKRVHELQRLFGEWNEEDGKLSEDEADRLQCALAQNGRLAFRAPSLD
jgi:hypothetical protein